MQQLNFFDIVPRLPVEYLEYKAGLFGQEESARVFGELQTQTQWEEKTLLMYGRPVKTPRLMAWYGDQGSTYQFTGNKYDPHPWTPLLQSLREQVENECSTRFNSVLLNYYRDAGDSVAWHSDNEPELKRSPVIASVSFGQQRKFDIRLKADHSLKHSVMLENGSLLIMKAGLQQLWEHRIAKSRSPLGPRINLTFRMVDRPG